MKFIFKLLPSNKTLAKVILLSLGLHLIFGLFFGSKVLLEHLRPDEVVLAAPPPAVGIEPQKRQYKVRVEKSQKNSSSPRPVPIAVDIPSDVSIEKVDIKVTQTSRVRGRGQGQGEGNGNGNGTGTGVGVSLEPDFIDFFGTRSKGSRFCFIVDYSLSMQGGGKIDKVRNELVRSLDQLSAGSKVSMVFFSGPCWVVGEDPEEIREDWVAASDKNKERIDGLKNSDYAQWGWAPFKEGRDVKIKKPKWKKVNPKVINEFKQYVLEAPLTYGTDWGPPFQLVIEKLKPAPDVIFFLTDGAPQVANEDKVVEFIKKKVRRKKTVINTISMGVPAAAPFLKEIAEFTGGEFKLL